MKIVHDVSINNREEKGIFVSEEKNVYYYGEFKEDKFNGKGMMNLKKKDYINYKLNEEKLNNIQNTNCVITSDDNSERYLYDGIWENDKYLGYK
jgi:hypothetical protein